MKSLKTIVSLSILLACATAPLHAAPDTYLPAGRPDATVLLAPPPQPASSEQDADMASTVAIFKARTSGEEILARSERKFSVFYLTPVIGNFFVPGKFPVTEAFFDRVRRDTDAVANSAKNFWKRPRPYVLDPELAAAGGEIEKSYSYPSGHSTRGMVFALLMADLFPDKKDSILEAGRNIGWRRVEIGRHYPTDIYAGRTLAQAIVREFEANPDFKADVAKVKEELSKASKPAELPALSDARQHPGAR